MSQLARFVEARRQRHLERRPLPHPALHRNLSAVIADDAVADAQAEAGALADIASREERIEDARQVRRVDAVAGVGHRELDGSTPALWRAPTAGGDLRAAHRLLGVEHQVEQHLLQLAEIGEHLRHRRPEIGRRAGAPTCGTRTRGARAPVADVDDVLRRAGGALAPREREQVADDPRRALRLFGNAAQVVGDFVRRPRVGRRAVPPRTSWA